MKAMLLAAGLGKRMLPLTHSRPKPLLEVAGKPLVQHHLEHLRACGIRDVVINVAHLGHMLQIALGDGGALGMRIAYSREPPSDPLETGGGIRRALGLLGDEPFLAISADSLARYEYPEHLPDDALGVLLMVDSPEHPGDYLLAADGRLHLEPGDGNAGGRLTYTGCALLHPDLIRLVGGERYPLSDCFEIAIAQGRLRGQVHSGDWSGVDTPEKLEQANREWSQGGD